MASNREKLEKKAESLGLKFVPETTDEELQQLINDFQNNDTEQEGQETFGSGFKFFESQLPGLSVQIGDEPDRDEQPNLVRFTPYEFFDEAKGDHYSLGYLATDEQDAIEVLSDDFNVKEITEDEYRKATSKGKRARY